MSNPSPGIVARDNYLAEVERYAKEVARKYPVEFPPKRMLSVTTVKNMIEAVDRMETQIENHAEERLP